ncbi:hypothetical protein AKJ16_DCAP03006 [Drosera capensis]
MAVMGWVDDKSDDSTAKSRMIGIFKGKSFTGITTIVIFFEPVRKVAGDERAETRTSEPSLFGIPICMEYQALLEDLIESISKIRVSVTNCNRYSSVELYWTRFDDANTFGQTLQLFDRDLVPSRTRAPGVA